MNIKILACSKIAFNVIIVLVLSFVFIMGVIAAPIVIGHVSDGDIIGRFYRWKKDSLITDMEFNLPLNVLLDYSPTFAPYILKLLHFILNVASYLLIPIHGKFVYLEALVWDWLHMQTMGDFDYCFTNDGRVLVEPGYNKLTTFLLELDAGENVKRARYCRA